MKITVVIPFFNRNELLHVSIPSVLTQTFPAHEIIVVDDCSPEDIGWLAHEFPTVRVLRLPENRKAAGARYHGALAATGTHIATLDGDDFWYPEKLEKQVAFALKIGDPRGIYAHQQWVEEGGGAGSVRPANGPYLREPTTEYLYVRGGFIQSNTFLIERSLYLDLCRISSDRFADDWMMVMRADDLHCRIYLLEEVLGQWNNTLDPKRISNSNKHQRWARDYLPPAGNFTPKAKSAFRGRWLGPRLIKQGEFFAGSIMIAQALFRRSLSPVTVIKIYLLATCPGLFKKAVIWYTPFRYRRKGRASGSGAKSTAV